MSVSVKQCLAREARAVPTPALLSICLVLSSRNRLAHTFRARLKATIAYAVALLTLGYDIPVNAAVTSLSNFGTIRGHRILTSTSNSNPTHSFTADNYTFTADNYTDYQDVKDATGPTFTPRMNNALGISANGYSDDSPLVFSYDDAKQTVSFRFESPALASAARANYTSRFSAERTPPQLYTSEEKQAIVQYAVNFVAFLITFQTQFRQVYGGSRSVTALVSNLGSALGVLNYKPDHFPYRGVAQCLLIAKAATFGGYGSSVFRFSRHAAQSFTRANQEIARYGLTYNTFTKAALKLVVAMLSAETAQQRIDAVLQPIPEGDE